MTINVYRIYGEESPVPLTVFAIHADQASAIYREWIARNMPNRSPNPTAIELCDERALDEFPQLAEALQQAVDEEKFGVGYWLGNRGGWFIQPALAPRVGDIAPLVSRIECFIFVRRESDDQFLVFAEDRDQANEIFQAWHEAKFGRPFEHVLFKEMSRWLLVDEQLTLREEMDIGMVGIAGWSQADGWHLYPPDHALAGKSLIG
jgi:hypothetical protein